jgi:hypothetical protein
MGNLQDFATNEEVEQYYGSKIIKTETQTQEENVEQNETNFIV